MLSSVAYANGTSLSSITRSLTGALTGIGWSFPAQDAVSDLVVRSQSGRIMKDTLTDGAATYTSNYSFDAAGRLVQASIPRHDLTYGFAGTGALTQRKVGLPGGVMISIPGSGARSRLFPNLHGDVILTTNYAGIRCGRT